MKGKLIISVAFLQEVQELLRVHLEASPPQFVGRQTVPLASFPNALHVAYRSLDEKYQDPEVLDGDLFSRLDLGRKFVQHVEVVRGASRPAFFRSQEVRRVPQPLRFVV